MTAPENDWLPLTLIPLEVSLESGEPPEPYRWYWSQVAGGRLPLITQRNRRWGTERRNVPAIAKAIYGDSAAARPVAAPSIGDIAPSRRRRAPTVTFAAA